MKGIVWEFTTPTWRLSGILSVLDFESGGLNLWPGQVFVLCSWARLFTFIVPQEYKRVLVNDVNHYKLGDNLQWASIPSWGSANTSSEFMLLISFNFMQHVKNVLSTYIVSWFSISWAIYHSSRISLSLTTISPYLSNASLRSENVVVFSMFPTKRVRVHPGSKSSSTIELPCERWRGGWSLLS